MGNNTDAYEAPPDGRDPVHRVLALCCNEVPLTIGEAARHLGVLWKLEDTEALLQRMESSGLVRQLLPGEPTYDPRTPKFYPFSRPKSV